IQQVLGLIVFVLVALCCRVLPRHELDVLRETISSTVMRSQRLGPEPGIVEQPDRMPLLP
ncbi:MAG: hypothetical protein JWO59_1693, partial [Chloroflexi bacterium]|nr:hypothetical protein [Chloroflexota bacterium]